MALCSLNRDLLRTTFCGYSLPEVKDIYLANFSEVTTALTAYTDTVNEACTEITAITLASGATFYHIEPAKDSVEFTDELVVEDNGNKYRTHTLTFNVSGQYDSCMRDALDALSLGRYFAVVVTADGQWLALGRLTGLEAETATLSGGGDTNGIAVTLSANVTESAMPLSAEAIADVKGE
ncbi:hypothetical protein [Methanobrevibacter sp.]|uniref:hypothetical protein n=1 Tax=Methanobrevibacter sp. TaxID=66852 RepID=UPI003869B85A